MPLFQNHSSTGVRMPVSPSVEIRENSSNCWGVWILSEFIGKSGEALSNPESLDEYEVIHQKE